MELINATKMQAGFTTGMKPNGRESIVVVVKGTFAFPDRADQTPSLAPVQMPLIEADTFSGQPGYSATVYESDYAQSKPRCDVLLNGSAYAPGGKPTERVTVSLRVGAMTKALDVIGNRAWKKSIVGVYTTSPEPFQTMPFSYNQAFGGMDNSHEDAKQHSAFRENPVGVGFHVNLAAAAIDGKPLPNTQELGKTVDDPRSSYRPMAFGPVGRSSLPRATYAGTYDDAWFANRFPFLPDDFDERYFQAAPSDQQINYPVGGEEVELRNLTPDGFLKFRLPPLDLPVEFFLQTFESVKSAATVDTVYLEPDLNRFVVTWRATIPLRRNIFEVPSCVVGTMSRGWYRARESGKAYYQSLDEMVAGSF
jgi:hypothetical protein